MLNQRTAFLTAGCLLIAFFLVLSIAGANGPGFPAGDSLTVDAGSTDSLMGPMSAVSDSASAGDTALAGVSGRDSLDEQIPPADSVRSTSVVPADSAQPRPVPTPLEMLRVVENRAFGVGERLEFEISYGPINAGSAVMEVKEIVKLEGRDCYQIISTARSNKFFSAIYRVEDHVESFLDVRGLFSWKFTQKLQEGKHRANRWAVYDQVNHRVTTNRGIMDVPPYVQDVLSTMYYVRTQPMEVGQISYVDNHSDRKIYPLAVKVHRRERVEVPAGTFDCFVVEPMLKAGGLFKHEGRIWVWLTDDERKLPVLMKTKVIIGTVDAKLKSYRPGKVS